MTLPPLRSLAAREFGQRDQEVMSIRICRLLLEIGGVDVE